MLKRVFRILRVSAACMLSLLILLLCACSDANVVSVKVSADKSGEVSVDCDDSLFIAPSRIKEMKKYAASGRMELYFDETTCSVGAYDTDMIKLWSSLPTQSIASESKPYVIKLTVIADGEIYTLNSQQNSVAAGLANYEATSSGIRVSYGFNFTTKSGTALIAVPVNYSLTDGSLFVSIDCSQITVEGGGDIIIREISLLDYFGSSVTSGSGDYLLVPDGCGAIIYTAEQSDTFKPVSLKVYGDPDSTEGTASVGAFGIKQGSSAMAAVIENGDAIATIKADTAENCGVNMVGASFELTEGSYDEAKSVLRCAASQYSGRLEICYRFLSESNANYAAMASACREQLIRSGILSSSLGFTADRTLPAVVSLIGAANLSGDATDKSHLTTLTTFEQAQDMLTLLKAKGLSNVSLRYKGVFDGGLNQTDITKFNISDALSNRESLAELTDYMNAQALDLYLDISLLSAASGSYSGSEIAVGANSRESFSLASKDLDGSQEITFNRQLLRLSSLEQTILRILKKSQGANITGFCLNDAGNVLYSDYSSGEGYNRQQAKQLIVNQSVSLVTGRRLMVSGGNIYMLKNASIACDLPSTCSGTKTMQYREIPFLQMILHGMMYYSSEPVNLADDPEAAIFKCIEYGAVPSFEWYYNGLSVDDGNGSSSTEANKYYYANWTANAYDLYEKANEALADLADARITDHYKVRAHVFCTEYSTDSVIYVNYGDTDEVVKGTTVEARSFLRIN